MHIGILPLYMGYIYPPTSRVSRATPTPGISPTPYTTYIYPYPTYTIHPTNPTRLAFTTVPIHPTCTPYPTYPRYLPHPVPPTRHGNHGDPTCLKRHARRFRLSELTKPVHNVRPRNLNPRWQTFKLYFFHAGVREGPIPTRPTPEAREALGGAGRGVFGPPWAPRTSDRAGIASHRASVTNATGLAPPGDLTRRHAAGKLEFRRRGTRLPNLTERPNR